MKRQYEPQNKGYVALLRSIQNLLETENVSLSTLGAYILFSFQADWDHSHKYYRAILPNDLELSKIWHCDKTTVYRNRIRLIEIGLFEKVGEITFFKNLELFKFGTVKTITDHNIGNSHLYYAKTENELAKMIFGIAKTHKNRLDKTLSL
ncbi:MAG: hypothetical protein NT162_01430 [Candidatus Woesebacteria bacterium]|nr:hypothetical protein [Candidatus Woesebacteria bacterium]